MSGKGDSLRPQNGDKYRKEYDRIFKRLDTPAPRVEPDKKKEASKRACRDNCQD
jgi:hypothetical protein